MVSIITNCYNGEKYLEETIQSVLAQTYTDWEYLLFDNNSTDRSAEIFKSHKDPRFKYYKNDVTVPLGHGRYLAEKLVQGDYVCFVDSDDLWLPTNLEKQVAIMEKDPEVGLVYSDYVYFGKVNMERNTDIPGFRCTKDLLLKYDPGLSSTMFRKSILLKSNISINKDFNIIADFDLFIKISLVSKVYHIKENLVKYRIHDCNLSSLTDRESKELRAMHCNLLNIMTKLEKERCAKGLQLILDKSYYLDYFVYMSKRDLINMFKCLIKIRDIKYMLSCIKRTLF